MANGIQTSIGDMSKWFAGMLADARYKTTETGTSEEASAEIAFGVMVKRGTADDGILRLTAVTDVGRFAGIVQHTHALAKDLQLGDVGIKPKTTVNVLVKGAIVVPTEEAVVPGDRVFVRCVATGAEVAGAFRKTADGTDTVDISAFARWDTSSVNGLAVLVVDLTNQRAAAIA